MLAEARSQLAGFAGLIASVAREKHRDGYEDCLAERDDQLAAARARKARSRFQVHQGGVA